MLMAAMRCRPFILRSRVGAYSGNSWKKYPMSLANLKRKLAATLRPPPPEPPPPFDDQAQWVPDEGDAPAVDAEDDFEGEGWSFWGV